MRIVALLALLLASAAYGADQTAYLGWRVTAEGLGSLRLGMSVQDASTAFGRDITKPDISGVQSPQCSSYVFGTSKPLKGVRLLVAFGVVKRIDVWTPEILTEKNIRIGSTRAEVRLAYPSLREFTGNYQDPEGSVALSDRVTLRVVFDHKNQVQRFWIGLSPEVNAVEGCL